MTQQTPGNRKQAVGNGTDVSNLGDYSTIVVQTTDGKEISEFSKLDKIDFVGLSDMVDESIDRVSAIYECRPMDANDVLDHIELLIPKKMIKGSRINLANEFVNRLFNNYKSKYGYKIKNNQKITRRIDYYRGQYE